MFLFLFLVTLIGGLLIAKKVFYWGGTVLDLGRLVMGPDAFSCRGVRADEEPMPDRGACGGPGRREHAGVACCVGPSRTCRNPRRGTFLGKR
ncbi:hypothetical protein NITMOv2_2769 [Nitrospira moscoviensis]|uniref:Uncharacterized protein n=1 Tax=Nitrospira moscoviensis TaxID=42253 RepID=A0A0K2GE04_NITMO|nr:hypothetical protein NITMOv2_2769 [Nitrospira moscoviensis]